MELSLLTVEKNNFTTNCTVIAAIFKDSVRVIAVAVVFINKMSECGSPLFAVRFIFC